MQALNDPYCTSRLTEFLQLRSPLDYQNQNLTLSHTVPTFNNAEQEGF